MKLSVAVAALSLFLLASCATPQKPIYNWGRYSASLYKLKKDPSGENLTKHKQVLLKIMEDSKENGQRVPPGVYCEYGYILLKEGKANDALVYLDLEEKTYPESAVFIERVKLQFTTSSPVSQARVHEGGTITSPLDSRPELHDDSNKKCGAKKKSSTKKKGSAKKKEQSWEEKK